jgi:poly(A) polymerase
MTPPLKSRDTISVRDAPWLSAAALKAVLAALTTEGGEARVVGGAVRNTLLGLPVTDIDIATTVRPEDVMRRAKAHGLGAYPTGISHGTVTVVSAGQPFEVTTLRRDIATDGRHALVAFTDDWHEDAKRRDFTINALYAAADGELFDFHGGIADLKARRVRFIGEAHDRIREDYLRILRFFRFTAEYGQGAPDAAGLAACRDLKTGLAGLSGERIGAETLKLIVAPRAADIVPAMAKAGVLKYVTGGPTDPRCFVRLAAIEEHLNLPPDGIARLAALLPDGVSTADLSRRLRLSNAQAGALAAAAYPHPAYSPGVPLLAAKAWLYHTGAENFRRGARLAWAKSTADTAGEMHKTRATLPDCWTAPELPIRGTDIIALGVAPGPGVGKILESFENWWIENDFPADAALQREKLLGLIQQR